MRVAPFGVKRPKHSTGKTDAGSDYSSPCRLGAESLKSSEFMRIAIQALWLVHVV